jgi:hypothetical protein
LLSQVLEEEVLFLNFKLLAVEVSYLMEAMEYSIVTKVVVAF